MHKIDLFKSVATGEETKEIEKVISSSWWAMGAKVAEFEKAFAKFTGAKYAVATNSCTAALDIACRVVSLPKTVRVSAFTFISSALAPLNAGYKVKFVDINPKTLCTDEADIQVLYAGNDHGKGLIYDMAHSGGNKHHGLVSCWSFHAVKNLPTGDGGMLTTNDEKIYKRAKALSWCGIDKSTFDRSSKGYSWEYNITEPGLKANMNDITAAIGLCQLKHLKKNNKYRAKIAQWYDKYLSKEITRPPKSSTWHFYTIRVPKRNELIDYLSQNGVSTSVHYKPLTYYKFFGRQDKLPNTEKAFEEILTLPMHVDLTKDDVRYVCNLINQWTSQF
jgi:perosamine synthetase